ncbi:unnamed protein product, partial [Tetraodon nigroviridis]
AAQSKTKPQGLRQTKACPLTPTGPVVD